MAVEFVLGQAKTRRALAEYDDWMADWCQINPALNTRAVEHSLRDALKARFSSRLLSGPFWDDRD